ncbi:MAG: oligosaccharide flippase family protein [Candidatus Eisenbacteria bacterium]
MAESERPLKLLLVAFRFPPQGGGGVQRSSKLIKYLSREGAECRVLMGPIEWSEVDQTLLEELPKEIRRTSVSVFPWRQWLVRRRERSSSWFTRHAARTVLWGLFQLLVPDMHVTWLFPAIRAGNRLIRESRPDVILVSGPPWTPFLVARILSARYRIPLVLDYRDPWTRSYLPSELARAARLFSPLLERWVLSGASGVIAAHRAILTRIRPVTPSRARLLWAPNGYDPDDFEEAPSPPTPQSRFEFVLTYTGSFFERRLPDVMVGVLEKLIAEGRIDPSRFRFRLAGSAGPVNRLLEGTPNLARCFQWVGYVRHDESLALLRTSTVNLVFESDDLGRNRTTPGKFYEVVRSGRPVLLLCPSGTTTVLAKRLGGCRIATPDDPAAIEKCILDYYQEWEAEREIAIPDRDRMKFYDRSHQASRVHRFLLARRPRVRSHAGVSDGTRKMGRMAAWNASSAAVQRLVGMIVSIVLTPFVLGELGRALYGVMTTAGSLFDYLTLFRGGLGSALRRHVTIRVHSDRQEEAKKYYQTGFWLGALLRIPILVMVLFAAKPLCNFVNLDPAYFDDAVPGVLLILVAAWLNDVATIFVVPTYATGNMGALSVFTTSTVLLRLILVFAAFHLFPPSLRLYGGVLIVLMSTLIVGQAWLAHRSRSVGPIVPKFSLGTQAIRRDLFTYGGLSLIEQVAYLLWLTGDNLLVGRFYGAEQVALYSLGARWMPLIQSFATTVFRSVQPLFTKLEAQADDKKTVQVTLVAISISSILAVPACLVPCVVGDLFLVQWIGDTIGADYRTAYHILLITLVPLTLDIAFSPIWVVLSAYGRVGWVSATEVSISVAKVALGLTLTLSTDMGILGFGVASAAALAVRSLFIRPITASRFPWLPSTSAMASKLVRSLVGGAPGLVLLALTRHLYADSMLKVILAGAIGAALTGLGSSLLVLGPKEIARLKRTILDPSGSGSPTGGDPGSSAVID